MKIYIRNIPWTRVGATYRMRHWTVTGYLATFRHRTGWNSRSEGIVNVKEVGCGAMPG